MIAEWKTICKDNDRDCDGCPMDGYCSLKPAEWDLKILRKLIEEVTKDGSEGVSEEVEADV